MRGSILKEILQPEEFVVVNLDTPIFSTNRLFRSLGWRFNLGPLIAEVNKFVEESLRWHSNFDVIWVDKGIFLEEVILKKMQDKGSVLVHYTPDTAFLHNRSHIFNRSLKYYDFCITTKSFELDQYRAQGAQSVLFCTQGYDPRVHFPRNSFSEKKGVVFIGLNEPSREEIIAELIESGVNVKLAGKKWNKFVRHFKNNKNLSFEGIEVLDHDYSRMISGSYIGLGLLSKRFPELHTTRTFEIPACGTLLASEKNKEIESWFTEDEVLYFSNKRDLAEKVLFYLAHPDIIEHKIDRAKLKLINLKVDYYSVLEELVLQMGLK
jgi:spore maturation protein CgeB